MEQFKNDLKSCMQNEPPFCGAACPFGFDVKDFISKLQKGSKNNAFRAYQNAVGFPAIVSEVCPAPCKNQCPRAGIDSAVNLKGLEKSVLRYATNKKPNSYSLPPKDKKIAIVGAGISGLACALRLASKKYQVTVYEKSDRIGGHLWDILPHETFLDDIKLQFINEEYDLVLNKEIANLNEIEPDYDAVYVATGKNGNDFGLEKNDDFAFATDKPGIFIGGSVTGSDTVSAIADGLNAVNAIERYLKTGLMNQPVINRDTSIEINTDSVEALPKVIPADSECYTTDEAVSEANRCLKCSCNACVAGCDLMNMTGKYPKRIWEEVQITINPGTLDGDGTVATRLISTCNHCGLCEKICPKRIDTGDFFLRSHRAMRKKDAMPWAFHEFWLRDMKFSNSEAFYVGKSEESIEYLYFPGCQIGASDYRYVTESYDWLLSYYKAGIMLGCCSAPAEWAGDETLRNRQLEQIKEIWLKLGKPLMIFACPSCKLMFSQYLPEMSGVFIYELMAKNSTGLQFYPDGALSVFDPCSAREENSVHDAIRKLTSDGGITLEPLIHEKELARCCGYGGQVAIAAPRYAKEVTRRSASEGNNPYVAYCINCRDNFIREGKQVFHIFDLVFGINKDTPQLPTVTLRRENRLTLKNIMIEKHGGTRPDLEETDVKLIISDSLKLKLDKNRLLENEVGEVVKYIEKTGNKLLNPENGAFVGHAHIGSMTCWVEYRNIDGCCELFNAYSHRMSLESDTKRGDSNE